MFSTKDDQKDEIADNVDEFNDSYARDVTPEELKTILDGAKLGHEPTDDAEIIQLSENLIERAQEQGSLTGNQEEFPPGWLFKGLTIYFHDLSSHRLWLARKMTEFGSAAITESLNGDNGDKRTANKSKGRNKKPAESFSVPTHVVIDKVSDSGSSNEITNIRKALSQMQMSDHGIKIPHLVTVAWVEQSWKERTLLDEESMFQLFSSSFQSNFCL